MACFIRATGSIPPPLADDPEPDATLPCGGDHRVAILEAGRQRLFHQDVHAGLGRQDRGLGVKRMRRADEDRLDPAVADHRRRRSVKGRTP